jgi:hypothetical protein
MNSCGSIILDYRSFHAEHYFFTRADFQLASVIIFEGIKKFSRET